MTDMEKNAPQSPGPGSRVTVEEARTGLARLIEEQRAARPRTTEEAIRDLGALLLQALDAEVTMARLVGYCRSMSYDVDERGLKRALNALRKKREKERARRKRTPSDRVDETQAGAPLPDTPTMVAVARVRFPSADTSAGFREELRAAQLGYRDGAWSPASDKTGHLPAELVARIVAAGGEVCKAATS